MGAVKRIVCWFKGHHIDFGSSLFYGTNKVMCWRCARIVDRPAATPKGGAK